MTKAGYYFKNFLHTIGMKPSNKLRLQAAFEAHLLRDAEMTIGSETWEEIENIGGLENVYKRLKKDAEQYRKLNTRVEEVEEQLDELQGKRHDSLTSLAVSTGSSALDADQKQRARKRLENETIKIKEELAAIERAQLGLRSKMEELEVNTDSTAPQERQRHEATYHTDNARKEQLERRLKTVVREAEELERSEAKLNKHISAEGQEQLSEADEKLDSITTLRNEYRELRSAITQMESGNLEQYTEVGAYLLNYRKEPEVKKVRKQHSSLFRTVDDIRDSYYRRQKLIGT